MDNKLYTTTEALNFTREKKERIQYWVRRGAIKPVDKGRGAGTTRMYSFANLFEIQLIQTLDPYLNNIDFIKRILTEVRNEIPSYFTVINDQHRYDNDECILTILIGSVNAIMVYVTGLKKANEITNRYLPAGLIAVQIDLNVLKKALVKKIIGGDSEKRA